jgi:hypothetical protein
MEPQIKRIVGQLYTVWHLHAHAHTHTHTHTMWTVKKEVIDNEIAETVK